MTRKIALITGANRGIGAEVARQLADKQFQVFLGVRNLTQGRAVATEIGKGATAVELDVADPLSPQRLFSEIGPVDVLVNNAAIHYDTGQSALTADWTIIRDAFETNFFGAWRTAQVFGPPMRSAGWGRIVNVSSEAGSLAGMNGGTPAYASTKVALNALTRQLAAELRNTGVLVNAVCPGWTATDMGGGGRPVPDGAASVVWAVTLPDSGPTGGFFRDGKALRW